MNYAPAILMAALTCAAVSNTMAQTNTTVRPKNPDPWAEFNPQPPPPPLPPRRSECTRYCILPPVEYDKPYKGKLTVETVPDQETLARFCGAAYVPGKTLGCASHDATSCRVLLVPDEIIKARGWTRALMLRHELGHCNGWPGDHPGQRSYDADDEARAKPIQPVLRQLQ